MRLIKTGSPFESYGLHSFITFCRPASGRLLLVGVVFILANVAIAIQPVYLGMLIDAVSQTPINQSTAWLYAIILILLSSGHNMLWRLAEFMYRGLVLKLSFDYENLLFKQVISKPYPYFVDKFTGKIGSYVTNTSAEVKKLLEDSLFGYLGSLVSVISVLLIMTSINWQTGLIIAVCLLSMIFVGHFTLSKDMTYQKIEMDISSTKNGRIIDAIANFVSVKSFHKEQAEYKTIVRQQEQTYKAAHKSFFWGMMFWGSQSFFVRDIMWPGIVALNLWLTLQGEISVGQFATVLSTAVLFSQSVWDIIWNISQFGQRVSRVEEAHTYLFGKTNIVKDQARTSTSHGIPTLAKDFTISHLSFAYPDQANSLVLKDLSLSINKGQKIGIVGKSGSGKSTLIKLLLNQYDTPDGTFSLDGRSVSAESLSKLITYVPQDTSLFHRNIFDNIAYASNGKATLKQVKIAAIKAEADEFIQQLPYGYDTMVGERGVKLSGGQRQRIAIARALLVNSPILVLDEATSALDSESESQVQKALENLWTDKTVIAIAHRLSTLRHMDQIIVMDDGKFTERGTHRELLDLGGTYAKLWAHQSGGFIEE